MLNVKVSHLGANVAHQPNQDAHPDLLDHPDLQANLDNPVNLAVLAIQEKLVVPLLAHHNKLAVLAAHLDQPDLKVQMDNLVILELMDIPEHLVVVEDKDPLAHPDLKVMLAHLDKTVNLVDLVKKEKVSHSLPS